MPVSENLKAPFYPGQNYHIILKSIDGLLLFREDMDYAVFLTRFSSLQILFSVFGPIAF
jgi:hypothetical protein